MPMPIAKSETTQNVAAGVLGGGVLSVGTVKLLRQIVPQWIPWDPDMDEAAVALAVAVITPILSRWVAFRRAPHKKSRYKR